MNIYNFNKIITLNKFVVEIFILIKNTLMLTNYSHKH